MGKWFRNKKRDGLRKVGYVGGDFDDLLGTNDQSVRDNKRSFKLRTKLDLGYFHHFVGSYALVENEKGTIEIAHYSCIEFLDK